MKFVCHQTFDPTPPKMSFVLKCEKQLLGWYVQQC